MVLYNRRLAKVKLIHNTHPSTEESPGTSTVKSEINTGNEVEATINPSYISVDEKCLCINGNNYLGFFIILNSRQL